MRSTLIVSILAAFIFGPGCGGYDRELLGEPQPAQPEAAEYAPPEQYEPADTAEAEEPRDVGMFDDLKFYGTWHWIDPYGWVWRPLVVSSWQPFLYGHWIWSQYGWMWVSYDPWGWATSYYGNWVVDFTYGWVWIPDYEWSPCRCDWILYDDYICWSPVPPSGVRYKEPWEDQGTPWVSVPVNKFKEPSVGSYRTKPRYKSGYSDRTLRRSAPEAHDIERTGSRTLGVIQVKLDRAVFGEREFARVQLPPEQEILVEEQRAKMKSDSSKPEAKKSGTTSPPPAKTDNGDTRTKSKSKAEPAKKDSGAKKDADKKDAPKYKEQKSEEKKKEDAKKEPKAKG
jgi:hypothetical protein